MKKTIFFMILMGSAARGEASALLSSEKSSMELSKMELLSDVDAPSSKQEKEVSEMRAMVLQGDYPDPTIIRDGKWYYMTHSAFDYVPGLTILKSKDLWSWEPVGYGQSRYIGSVWAPDICKYKDRYYIYFTVAAKGKPFKNFVVYADDINGKWSEPIDLHVDGKIDPCHVVDEKTGERWLFVSGGNRIRLSEDGLSVYGSAEFGNNNVKNASSEFGKVNVKKSSEEKAKLENVYKGWSIPRSWEIESTSLEGPKIKKVGDWYYYLSAMGGTSGPAT